jgi:hypothetical protein
MKVIDALQIFAGMLRALYQNASRVHYYDLIEDLESVIRQLDYEYITEEDGLKKCLRLLKESKITFYGNGEVPIEKFVKEFSSVTSVKDCLEFLEKSDSCYWNYFGWGWKAWGNSDLF